MRQNISKGEIVVLIAYGIMGFIIIFTMLNVQPNELKERVSIGQPYRFYDEKGYVRDIEDICINGDFLFLVYRCLNIVKIYHLNGDYVCSYAFKGTTGHVELYIDDNNVYLEDEYHNFYVFCSDQFVKFIEYESYAQYREYGALFKTKEKQRMDKNGNVYYLRLFNVCTKDENGRLTPLVKGSISFYGHGSMLRRNIIIIVLMYIIIVSGVINRGFPIIGRGNKKK